MQAIHLTGPSTTFDAFERVSLPDPVPGHGQVLVRMRAASLNFLDVAVATGNYPGVDFPLIPVADGAGEVVATGPGVDGFAPGQRVLLHPKEQWAAGRPSAARARAMRGVDRPGALCELAVAPADALVRVPEHLSWEQAAALPVTATTAWNALVAADIGPGSHVVLLGTGGVGIAALQLARSRGASVIVLSSSDDKLARARQLGAQHTVNYHSQPAWDGAVRELTGGQGADLVIETVGPATLQRSIAALRHGGTVFTVGFLSGTRGEVDLMPVIVNAIRLQGANTGSAEDLADAVAAIAAHRIEPVVDRVFGLDELADAYALLASGKGFFGKIGLRVDFGQ